MKQIKIGYYAILLLIGLATTHNMSAQETYTVSPDAENWECGYDQTMMSTLASDTGFIGRMERYNYAINNPPYNTPQAGAPFIVPVVFHLISSGTVTPSYDQIRWQLARINAAFQNQMNLFCGQVNGPRAVNTQIEFRLACAAQNSVNAWTNATEPGVMRYHNISNTNITTQGVLTPVTYTPMLAMTHPAAFPNTFPFTNYLNIWCVPQIGTGTTIGYGTFPWSNQPIDGIVMDIDVIGNNTYSTNFPLIPQLDKGAILVHEIGHYLGLYHTFETMPTLGVSPGCFGNAGNATTDGDMILDTPPTFITSDLGSLPSINSCRETNSPYGPSFPQDVSDQLENYMSYSDDDKLNTFTQGQAIRMISSFTVTTPPTVRFNLNHPTNLSNTGVLPNSCTTPTTILTGIFNYSIAPGSSCTSVNVQFTNPLSVGFNTVGTTYTWNFGNGTGTGSNPIRTYSTSGGTLYTVSCTASNGTATATYTQNISINANVSITGQSGLNMPVCRGSEQTIYLSFGVGVPSVLITDGTNTVTVNNSMSLGTAHIQAYTFQVNASASYSLVPVACYSASATFSVIDCCTNLITNGDFESGNTSFYSQLTTTASCFGAYSVVDVNAGVSTKFMPNTGNSLACGGFAGSCATSYSYNIPEGCNTTTNTPVIWQQTLTLQPNTQYSFSFKITEGYNNLAFFPMILCRDLNFRARIYNNASGLFFSPTIIPIRNNGAGGNPNAYVSYVANTFTFTTPALSGTMTPTTTFSVELNQINHFYGSYYDYIIDNISLNQLTPGIQALGSATICKGASAALTTTTNCGQLLADYNIVWSPSNSLSCNTCTNPIASPSVTTVYTLVATPTSTVGSPSAIVSTVTITVKPTFTITPPSQIIYAGQSATITVSGSTGTYSWMPSSLTGSVVVVTPTATTVYTVTNAASGTCTANNTSTVTVSAACSQSATASYTNYTIPSGTYTAAGTVIDLAGTITIAGNTSLTGYTLRMAPGSKILITFPSILTLDNCKLFGCTELWQGIELETLRSSAIYVKNGTTIEDMYAGIYAVRTSTLTSVAGIINIENSKLNKNYVSVQLNSVTGSTLSGVAYSLTVKNSTITTESSLTSPGNNLKSSTTYTYAYNQIAGGAGGSSAPYTNFPRGLAGIYLNNLSATNPVVIGDSTGSLNTYNKFSNLDFGIYATNAQLRVHNNYFFNMMGSTKRTYFDINNPVTVVGPDEIGIAIVAQHTVANTYSLQVGTKNSTASSVVAACPKANAFKTVNKAISAKNCKTVIAKGNLFDADATTDVLDVAGGGITPTSDSYLYNQSQSAIWVSGLSKDAGLNYNYIKNYNAAIYAAFTMSVSSGAYLHVNSNNIQSQQAAGFCTQAINIEQVGGANIGTDLLEIANNSITKVYRGIYIKSVLEGVYLHDNANITIDNVKILGKGAGAASFVHHGINMLSTQKAKVFYNTNINSITTSAFTATNYSLTNAVYVATSTSNTITCNTINNVGRAFGFQGGCTSNNGWLGNSMSNSYTGLELRTNGVIGIQGTTGGAPLAANTWSNVTRETYVVSTNSVNANSIMFVQANGTYTTAPSLNAAATATQAYVNAPGSGIDIKTGTSYTCPSGGGGFEMMTSGDVSSEEASSINNDSLYAGLAKATNAEYAEYADEMVFANRQLVYQLQKQGLLTHSANSVLQNFYTNHTNSNIGKFSDVRDAITANQLALAQSKNNSINPANVVQQKTKRTNELLLKLNNDCNYKFSTTEWQDLTAMANECAVKGWYVAQSRNILNAVNGYLINYADECEQTKSSSRLMHTEESTTGTPEKERSFVLFPNPNNGNMVLTYDLGDDDQAEMHLFDVTGKLVNSYVLSNNTGNIEMNEARLQNGIYFYRILVKGKTINTNKIVIIK